MYLSMRDEWDLLFTWLSSRKQWLCFCAGQVVGSYWHNCHNDCTPAGKLYGYYMRKCWACCSHQWGCELKYFLMKVQGNFCITWILWLDHQNYQQSFHLLIHVGKATEQRSDLVGDVHAAPVPQGMSVRSVESPRPSQEGACKKAQKTSSSHVSQRQAIHLAHEISDQCSNWVIMAVFAEVVVIFQYKISALID